MSDAPADAPAGWHPDPHGRHELRYWDGAKWSDHISNSGVTGTDPSSPKRGGLVARFEDALAVGNKQDPDKVKAQVTGTGRHGAGRTERAEGGGGSLFTEPILVVNQKTKIIELHNQYSVFDQDGNVVAIVDQIGQSQLKQAARLVSSLDQFMTHKMQITDPSGAVLMHLTRPRKIVKSSIIVSDADDQELGRIVQRRALGKIRFGLESHGTDIGMIKAENWRAWNFRIENAEGNEVARITKTWEGLARTAFTTADNYVVEIKERQPEPLNSLIIASALSVDTALKQDDRGMN